MSLIITVYLPSRVRLNDTQPPNPKGMGTGSPLMVIFEIVPGQRHRINGLVLDEVALLPEGLVDGSHVASGSAVASRRLPHASAGGSGGYRSQRHGRAHQLAAADSSFTRWLLNFLLSSKPAYRASNTGNADRMRSAILGRQRADTVQQPFQPRRFGPPKALILQIQVVDHLRDGLQRASSGR